MLRSKELADLFSKLRNLIYKYDKEADKKQNEENAAIVIEKIRSYKPTLQEVDLQLPSEITMNSLLYAFKTKYSDAF